MNEKLIKSAFYIIFIITALCLIALKNLKLDTDLNQFLPSHDSDVSFYNEFRNQFHSDVDDETLIIGLENSKGIFQKEFLAKVDTLTQYITKLKHITKAYSLTNFSLIYFDKDQFYARPLIRIYQPEYYTEDSINVFISEEYRNLMISKSGKAIAIAVFNEANLESKEKDEILQGIQNKINVLGFDKTYLTGKINIERAFIKAITRDFLIIASITIFIACLLSIFMFSSLSVLMIPLMTIVISLIWTISLMVICGVQPDKLSYWIPIVLTVFSGLFSILFVHQYLTVLNTGVSKEGAAQNVFAALNFPIVLSTAAAALVFFSMAVSDIVPLKIFGIFAGLGILLSYPVFIITFFSFSDILPDSISNECNKIKEVLRRISNRIYQFGIKQKFVVLALFACMFILAAYFSSTRVINGKLVDEIPRGDEMLENFNFIDNDFYGTRRFELALIANSPEKSFLNLSLLKDVETIENYLNDSCQLAYVISPISLLKGANKAYKGGSNKFYLLPDSQNEINTYAGNIMQTQYADEMQRYLSDNGEKLRISGRLPDMNAREFEQLRGKFDSYFRDHNFSTTFSYKITGSIPLLEKIPKAINKEIELDMYIFLLILISFGLYLFRSWPILVSLSIAVLTSVILSKGLLGVLGISLNPELAIALKVSLAILLFNLSWMLYLVKNQLAGNTSIYQALEQTFRKAGGSLVISNIIFLIGFLCFLSSSFLVVFNAGLLISVNLLFSLVFSLSILPGLLILFCKK
jgi:predicted RND superfamily exporter protein